MDAVVARSSLTVLIERCQGERKQYRDNRTTSSPACVEIFRRAFKGDQEAWAAVQSSCERQMRAWIGVQRMIEPDEALQEGLLAFARFAPQQTQLVATDELGPILLYLRRCMKTAVLMLLRKQRMILVSLDEQTDLPPDRDQMEAIELRETLLERIQSLIATEEEQLVFRLYFLCDLRPKDILEDCREKFTDISAVNTVIQRLTRRLRNDPIIRELGESRREPVSVASLHMSVDQNKGNPASMELPCTIDEIVLLEYVAGRATTAERAAIERSPACLRAAAAMRRELLPLLQLLYRAGCPDVSTLVAYQEQRLDSTAALVIRRHLIDCPTCQAEYAILADIDAVPLGRTSWAPRIVIEALPTLPPLALRGTVRFYQSPPVSILLAEHQLAGPPRTWTLTGQTRTPDGLQAAGLVQTVSLQSEDQPDQAAIQGQIEPSGEFTFQNLSSGRYRLSLVIDETEIAIPHLLIGDAP